MSDKKYKYVVVSGCSFSASDAENTPRPGETYGDVVANHFGGKCYNLARSGGSLPHMQRVVMKWCSKNLEKWKDTLIILGLTSINRMEIWNNKAYNILKENSNWTDEKFPTFKSGDTEIPVIDHQSGPWYGNFGQALQIPSDPIHHYNWLHTYPFINEWTDKERKNYFINFYNDHAQFLLSTQIIIGLQSFFKLNDIDYIFFDAISADMDRYWREYCSDDKEDKLGHKLLFDTLVTQENWFIHPKYRHLNDLTASDETMRFSKTDMHPNKKAHKYWGECLLEYIKS